MDSMNKSYLQLAVHSETLQCYYVYIAQIHEQVHNIEYVLLACVSQVLLNVAAQYLGY